MFRTFATAAIIVLAWAGSAHAFSAGASAAHHKHWPHCAQGMVTATCTCWGGGPGHFQLCHKGQWCHTYSGACTQ
jgi:hypothetical protein